MSPRTCSSSFPSTSAGIRTPTFRPEQIVHYPLMVQKWLTIIQQILISSLARTHHPKRLTNHYFDKKNLDELLFIVRVNQRFFNCPSEEKKEIEIQMKRKYLGVETSPPEIMLRGDLITYQESIKKIEEEKRKSRDYSVRRKSATLPTKIVLLANPILKKGPSGNYIWLEAYINRIGENKSTILSPEEQSTTREYLLTQMTDLKIMTLTGNQPFPLANFASDARHYLSQLCNKGQTKDNFVLLDTLFRLFQVSQECLEQLHRFITPESKGIIYPQSEQEILSPSEIQEKIQLLATVVYTKNGKPAERRLSAGLFCDEFVAKATDEEQNEPDEGLQPARSPFLAGTAVLAKEAFTSLSSPPLIQATPLSLPHLTLDGDSASGNANPLEDSAIRSSPRLKVTLDGDAESEVFKSPRSLSDHPSSALKLSSSSPDLAVAFDSTDLPEILSRSPLSTARRCEARSPCPELSLTSPRLKVTLDPPTAAGGGLTGSLSKSLSNLSSIFSTPPLSPRSRSINLVKTNPTGSMSPPTSPRLRVRRDIALENRETLILKQLERTQNLLGYLLNEPGLLQKRRMKLIGKMREHLPALGSVSLEELTNSIEKLAEFEAKINALPVKSKEDIRLLKFIHSWQLEKNLLSACHIFSNASFG